MASPDHYCPFDVVGRPVDLDLVEEYRQSPFGPLHTVKSTPHPTKSVVTVFIHGFGGSWKSWTPLLQAARQRGFSFGDVLLPDLPGFGSSSHRVDEMKMRDIGDFLLDLTSTLGWEKVRIIGHSMGGFLGLDMASRRDPRIESLVSLAGAYFSILDVVRQGIRSFQTVPRTAASYYGLRVLSCLGPVGPIMVARAYRLGLLPLFLKSSLYKPSLIKPGILKEMSTAFNPNSFHLAEVNGINYDAFNTWSQIEIPSLFVFGDYDSIVPARDMATIQRALPQSRAVLLQQTGHFPHFERPFELLDQLSSFST